MPRFRKKLPTTLLRTTSAEQLQVFHRKRADSEFIEEGAGKRSPQSPETETGADWRVFFESATNRFRFERSAMYSRASLYSRRRSAPLKIAFRTMRQATRGRKKYSP